MEGKKFYKDIVIVKCQPKSKYDKPCQLEN